MTQTETRYLIDSRQSAFEQLLAKNFEQIEVNKERCFLMPSGGVVTITPLYSVKALVIEYAENLTGAEQNAYEDGDLFFVEEYTEEELLKMMLQEILNDTPKMVYRSTGSEERRLTDEQRKQKKGSQRNGNKQAIAIYNVANHYGNG